MDVTQAGVGSYDFAKQQVDPQHRAARVSVRPPDVGVYGSYQVALASGLMAAGLPAASPIYSFRWSAPGVMAVIRRLRITAAADAVAFAQGSVVIDLIRATNFSVQDAGGQTLTLAGKSNALASRFSPSQAQIAGSAVGSIAVANTGALTAGTRTLDNNPLAVLVGSVGAIPATLLIPQPGYLLDPTDPTRTPLELMAAEGFVVRATVPATGTWKFGVEVAWDETDPARWF